MDDVDVDHLWIYHERQQGRLSGLHALNNLIQNEETLFTTAELDQYGKDLKEGKELDDFTKALKKSNDKIADTPDEQINKYLKQENYVISSTYT